MVVYNKSKQCSKKSWCSDQGWAKRITEKSRREEKKEGKITQQSLPEKSKKCYFLYAYFANVAHIRHWLKYAT